MRPAQAAKASDRAALATAVAQPAEATGRPGSAGDDDCREEGLGNGRLGRSPEVKETRAVVTVQRSEDYTA